MFSYVTLIILFEITHLPPCAWILQRTVLNTRLFRRNKFVLKKGRLPSKYELTYTRYPESDDDYDEVTFDNK